MKKVLLLVLPLFVVCSGCVAAGHQMGPPPGGYPAHQAMHPQPAARFPALAVPIGRWDNVMMLALDSTVQVLRAGRRCGDRIDRRGQRQQPARPRQPPATWICRRRT